MCFEANKPVALRACLDFFKLIINSLWFWRNIEEGIYRDK